jgi:hypothetical protein
MDEQNQNQFEQVASDYQLVPAQKRPVRSSDWGLAGIQRKKTPGLMFSLLPENVCHSVSEGRVLSADFPCRHAEGSR